MGIRRALYSVGRRLGFDVAKPTKFSETLLRRKQLLDAYAIDCVLDVGANAGQFATQVRLLGYRGDIVSFEPMQAAFQQLRDTASGDAAWKTCNFGLGERIERLEINVAANSYSSSLLGMMPAHATAAPDSKYVGREQIEIKTLDEIFGELGVQGKNIYLKIDTQGFELPVLRGAERSLQFIDTLQLELSLVQLYENEPLYDEVCAWLASRKYQMVSIEPGFADPATGRLLQFDGVFHRY